MIEQQTLGEMVDEFNSTYKVDCYLTPTTGTTEDRDLTYNLIYEEFMEELMDAMDASDVVGMADAFTDILYVTAQQMRKLGMPVDSLLREVHRSNMSKLGEDGKPIFREDGKVLKGPNYFKPNIKGVLEAAGL